MCLVLAPFTLGGLSLNLQNICYHQSTFLAYVTKSNLTLWYSEGLLTAIYGKFWLTHPNCCFHLFFLLMCKSCGFIFVSNPTFFSCINAWVAFFYYWDFYCKEQVCQGWMCLREGSGAASSSSSPAAMTVTRTSASAQLMASDKCVMGELSVPEVHGGSVHERDTVETYGYILSRCARR